MKKECKYFIIILFLLYFNYSCSQKQNEIKSIVVDQFGYRNYLSEGRGTVYKIRMLNKANQLGQRYEGYLKEYKFNISHRSINYIKKIYYNNDLKLLPDYYVLSSTNVEKHGQIKTTITFYFKDDEKKMISFLDDGSENPLDRFPDKKIKPIFKEVFQYIKKIKDSTGERSEIPR